MKKTSKGEKISAAMKGRKLTEEHKEKLSKAKLGKARAESTKEKIKKTLLGQKIDTLKQDHPLILKTHNSRSHLTAENVKEIRDLYTNAKSNSIRKLAKEFNVSRHTIHSIVTYRTWNQL
ncbi:helix-turn-helix domain-containing protein [Metabacillus herbersteinensis]|uniref:Helix-turn-helix domain-containing protein n=1 Tax=Metabacillus herbersteinensis TaxID=283816 RepID=A0ABV6GF22_9BACI